MGGTRRYSLRFKLALGLVLILSLLFTGLNAVNLIGLRESRRQSVELRTATVTRLIASALVERMGLEQLDSPRVLRFLNTFIASVLSNELEEDLAFVAIVDMEANVLTGHVRPELIELPGTEHADDETVLATIAHKDGALGGLMRTKRFTIKNESNQPLGKVLVGTSLRRVEQQLQRDLAINIGVFGLGLLFMLFYTRVALNKMVLNPLSTLSTAMEEVTRGNFTQRLELKQRDEIGLLAESYNYMVQGLEEREALADAFKRYVSPQVYERLQQSEITFAGEHREATILFSDIRGFTSLSETVTPRELVELLNDYFTEMVDVIFKNGGFVNKFIGDAIMAVYNAPLDQHEHAYQAVQTGLEMVEALKRFNARREKEGKYALQIGIGINTGPVVAGNIGHSQRLEYTVIGDAVNLAQRIESQTKVANCSLLISESTFLTVATRVISRPLPEVHVKGKSKPVPLYAVTGLREG